MGKKLDALLGRNFKTSKFKSLVNLAISRLAVLKNQRQVRCSQARSDTSQLLNLGHQDRALLRVEQVIKEQNMLDVFVMIEGYCHLLIERVVLIENNKECPDELKEAISSVIFAASRCGEFPELPEIRSIFASRFGKEFASRAVDLRNNCGVNPKMIQKMSTRRPSLESRMKVLQEIASENGITLHLEEEASQTTEEKMDSNRKPNHPKTNVSGNLARNEDQSNNLTEEMDQIERNEQTSGSLRARKKYANVASAAQAAFESAAYAAAAARAAVELSRSESQDFFPDGQNTPVPRSGNRSGDDGSPRSRLGNHVGGGAFGEVEHSTGGLGDEKIHHMENSDSESEGGQIPQNQGKFHPGDFKERTNKENLERSLSDLSLDSDGDSVKKTKTPPNLVDQSKPLEKMVFDESDDETENEYGTNLWSNDCSLEVDEKSRLPINEFQKTRRKDTISDSEETHLKRLNIERRPISVRTRRGNGR